MQQASEEWFRARAGKITASRIKDVVAGDNTAAYKQYRAELVAERLGAVLDDGYTNSYMERGNELEPLARQAYEAEKLVEVKEVGFVVHPEMPYAGASPDGMTDGLLEIKCRKTHLHIEYILSGKISKKDIRQMQWQMACTGAKWCDFVSYDPRLPGYELWIKRVERDEKMIEEITAEVKKLNDEVETIIEKLKR